MFTKMELNDIEQHFPSKVVYMHKFCSRRTEQVDFVKFSNFNLFGVKLPQ